MSEPLTRLPEPTSFSDARQARATNLMATAQFLVFEPGLYALDVTSAHSAPSDMGIRLPTLRLEPVPPTAARPGRTTLVSSGDGGWLGRGNESGFVVVVGGRAGAVLTVYRANDGSPPPEIRVRHIETALERRGQPRVVAGAEPAPDEATPPPATQPMPQAVPMPQALPMVLLAHVSGVGDLSGTTDRWVGRPGSGAAVEGFAITPNNGIAEDDIEYQAILGNNWNTPWFHGGEFCGSRGLMLPLLGFRVRLTGAAAEKFVCSYSGQFVGGHTAGPVQDSEACEAGDAPLEAILVSVAPRPVGADATAAPTLVKAGARASAAEEPPGVPASSRRADRRPVRAVKAAAPTVKK